MNRVLLGYSIFASISFLFIVNFALDRADSNFYIPEEFVPLIAMLPFISEVNLSNKWKVLMLLIVNLLTFAYFVLIVEFGGFEWTYNPYADTVITYISIAMLSTFLWFVTVKIIQKYTQ